MKKLIRNILSDVAKSQVNLTSESSREMIVNLIMAGIKSNKGWFLDLGTHVPKPMDTAGMPIKKIDKWLRKDIDEVVMIDSTNDDSTNDSKPKIKPLERQYTVVEDLGWDARDKKQTIIGRISESEYEWLIASK